MSEVGPQQGLVTRETSRAKQVWAVIALAASAGIAATVVNPSLRGAVTSYAVHVATGRPYGWDADPDRPVEIVSIAGAPRQLVVRQCANDQFPSITPKIPPSGCSDWTVDYSNMFNDMVSYPYDVVVSDGEITSITNAHVPGPYPLP